VAAAFAAINLTVCVIAGVGAVLVGHRGPAFIV
jgi:hypothetical protein